MNSEFLLEVSGRSMDIFMQQGFFSYGTMSTALHRHRYPELHAVAAGTAVFIVEGETVTLSAGEMVVVESGAFHQCKTATGDIRHIVFQINTTAALARGTHRLSLPVLKNALDEIDEYRRCGKSAGLKAYLTLICAEFIPHEPLSAPAPINDRAFIIYEFFANNYNSSVSIGDLAAELGVCEKQAERLTRRYTGNTFRTEISKRRIEAAKRLMAEGKMSLADIAYSVGYRSYSGFWKAYGAAKKREEHGTSKL